MKFRKCRNLFRFNKFWWNKIQLWCHLLCSIRFIDGLPQCIYPCGQALGRVFYLLFMCTHMYDVWCLIIIICTYVQIRCGMWYTMMCTYEKLTIDIYVYIPTNEVYYDVVYCYKSVVYKYATTRTYVYKLIFTYETKRYFFIIFDCVKFQYTQSISIYVYVFILDWPMLVQLNEMIRYGHTIDRFETATFLAHKQISLSHYNHDLSTHTRIYNIHCHIENIRNFVQNKYFFGNAVTVRCA